MNCLKRKALTFGALAALLFSAPSHSKTFLDPGGETWEHVVSVAAIFYEEIELCGFFGSSGTLHLGMAWKPGTKACVCPNSIWAFHRPNPTKKALSEIKRRGGTEADVVRIYGSMYPSNLRRLFYTEITMKFGSKSFTGSQLGKMDSELRICPID